MSNNLQPLNSIMAAEPSQTEHSSDPLKKEYEDGKMHLANKEYGAAAVALHNVLVAYQEKGDTRGIANASNQLGLVCLQRGEFANALEHFEKALQICVDEFDRMSELAVLKKMVEAYRGCKDYEKAMDKSFDILDRYSDNRDPQGTVEALELVAELYLLQDNKAGAADTYRTIASIHKNFSHSTIAAGYLEKAEALDK